MPSLKLLSGTLLTGQIINLGLSIAVAGLMGNVLHWVSNDSFAALYSLDSDVVQVPDYTPGPGYPFIAPAPQTFEIAGSQLVFLGAMASAVASLLTITNLTPIYMGNIDPVRYKLPARFAFTIFLSVLSATFSIFVIAYSWTEFYQAKPIVYTAEALLTGEFSPSNVTPESFNRDIVKMVIPVDKYRSQELYVNAAVARIMSLPVWVIQVVLLAVVGSLWRKVNAILAHREAKGKSVEVVCENVDLEGNIA